jgi:hypothetical protein
MRFVAWLGGILVCLISGPATLAAIDDRYPPITWMVIVAAIGGSIICTTGCAYEFFRALSPKSEIRIHRPRRLGTRIGTIRPSDELAWDRLSPADHECRRRVLLYVVNETDQQQRLTIQPGESRVVWPRYPTQIYVEHRELTLEPHEGGNLDFLITNPGVGWPDKADWPHRIYWLWIRGHTRSGRTVRFFGPVRGRPLRIANANGLTDYLIHVTRLGLVRPN